MAISNRPYFLLLRFLLLSSSAFSQQSSLNGKVYTSDGKPAAHVTIKIEGIPAGMITAENGEFFFKNMKPGNYSIKASFVGLKTVKKAVSIVAYKTASINILLIESASELQEVTITSARSVNHQPILAGKMSIKPLDLPQAITVIGQSTIEEQQSLRLSDVIKNVNGVYMSTMRGSTQESFAARGYAFGSNNMFKNGSRVNSGSMPEVSGLERVEILKGSAAILYGNVAPGGILNMVTKQPKFENGGQIGMTLGSYNEYKPTVDIYGPINNSVAYRFNGTYENAGSFRQSVNSKRYYFNPSFLFKLGSKTDLTVQGDYLNHKFTPDFGTGAINNQVASVSRNAFFGTSWANANTQQFTSSAILNHKFNMMWQLTSTLAYQNYNRDYFSTERIQPVVNGDWTRPLNKSKTGEDYYTGQINLTGKFETGFLGHNLLTGVDADSYLNLSNTFNAANYDVINILDPNKYTPRTDIPTLTALNNITTPTKRFGAYVQDLMSISEKVKVLAGVRWSYQDTRPTKTLAVQTGAVTYASSRQDQAFSPRFGLVYQPVNNTSLFASYSNSFTPNTGIDINNNPLAPSLINQYEAGLKHDFFNGLLSTNFTLYHIKNNNLVQTAPFLANGTPNNNTNFRELAGATKSNGIELDIAGHPIAGLNVIAGYSYNDMRYTSTPGNTGSNIVGERVVNTPAHTANASVFYTVSGTKLKGLKLGVTAVYIGDRIAGWNNTTSFNFGSTGLATRQIPLSRFTTIDFSAGYSIKKFSLLAKMSNIGNVLNYYGHENYSINPIAPRQFATTLAYKF